MGSVFTATVTTAASVVDEGSVLSLSGASYFSDVVTTSSTSASVGVGSDIETIAAFTFRAGSSFA